MGLSLVFAAACNSHRAAEAFASAGVPHVVGTTERVADDTVRRFAAVFYGCLIGQAMTVGAAFDRARHMILLELGIEEAPFVLIGRGTDEGTASALIKNRPGVHGVRVFGDAEPGHWVDETPPPPPAVFPPPPTRMWGREVVTQEAFALARTTPCVCLKAADDARGLGLSALVSSLCRYAHRRRFPAGGIVHVAVGRRQPPHRAPGGVVGMLGRYGSAAEADAEAAAAAMVRSPQPMWQRVWRAVRRTAAFTGLLDGVAEPDSESRLLRILRKHLHGCLLVIDGVDALERVEQTALPHHRSTPSSGSLARPALGSGCSPEEEEDEDEENDGGGEAASAGLGAGGMGSQRSLGMPDPSRGCSADDDASLGGDDAGEEGGPEGDGSGTPAGAGAACVTPSSHCSGRVTSPGVDCDSKEADGEAVEALASVPSYPRRRAESEAAPSPVTPDARGITRASSVQLRRQGSARASPGTDDEARAFISRAVSSAGCARVVYTTCHRPLAPHLEAGGSEAVVEVRPLQPDAAGLLLLGALPGRPATVGDLGISAQQYNDCKAHTGLAVGRYVPAVSACGGRPAVLLRLARILAQVGGGVLGNALREIGPRGLEDLVVAAESLDSPLEDAVADAGVDITLPAGLAAAASDGSEADGDTDGDLGRGGSGLSHGTLGLANSAGADPFFGPRDPAAWASGAAAALPRSDSAWAPDPAAASSAAQPAARDGGGAARPPTDALRAAFGEPAHDGLGMAMALGQIAQYPMPAPASPQDGRRGAEARGAAAPAADWTAEALLGRANELFGLHHELDMAGAGWWLQMRLLDDDRRAPADRPVRWESVLWATRSMLEQSAPAGLAARDLCEGDVQLIESVLHRAGQPMGRSRTVSLTQWATALWPWLRDACAILESAEALWALREPAAAMFPFMDSDAAAAMLSSACDERRAGAFVVRLSASLPCGVAVSYTCDGVSGVVVQKVLLRYEAGLWLLNATGGSVHRSTTLAGLLQAVDVWTLLPHCVQLQGFVSPGADTVRYELVEKADVLGQLDQPAGAAPGSGYKSIPPM